MLIFRPSRLRLRISGTVTFCGFMRPSCSKTERALWTESRGLFIVVCDCVSLSLFCLAVPFGIDGPIG